MFTILDFRQQTFFLEVYFRLLIWLSEEAVLVATIKSPDSNLLFSSTSVETCTETCTSWLLGVSTSTCRTFSIRWRHQRGYNRSSGWIQPMTKDAKIEATTVTNKLKNSSVDLRPLARHLVLLIAIDWPYFVLWNTKRCWWAFNTSDTCLLVGLVVYFCLYTF